MTATIEDYPAPVAESRQWMSRAEAAERLGVTTQTLDRYVKNGRIQRYKIAGSRLTRFRVEDVNRLFETNTNDEQ